MRRVAGLACIVAVSHFAARAAADSIVTNDGTTFEGKILDESTTSVTIQTSGRKETIPRAEIKTLTHGPVVSDADDPTLDDEVVLADGTTLRGKITDKKEGKYVVLSANGRSDTIAWSEIAKLGKVAKPKEPEKTPEPGAPVERVILRDGTTVEGHIGDHEWGKYVVVESASGTQRIEWANVARCVIPASLHYAGSAVHLTKEDGKLHAEAGGTFTDAAEARKAWLARGGSILGFDAQGEAVALYWKIHGVTVTGFGGGVAIHGTYYYLFPPDTTKNESTWYGFRIGAGVDSTGFIANASGGGGSVGVYGLTIPFSIGAQAGFGTYRVFDEWNGVMVGVDYKPSYAYNKSSLGPGSGSFNYLGFQITADFVRFKTIMDRYEKALKEPHWRVSLFVLPPVSDLPLLVEVGMGAVWY